MSSNNPLRDGYYLSTYLTEPGLPFLMSSWTRHDNNVSLWRKSGSDVSLVHYWEIERFSGVKHHGFGVAGTEQATTMFNTLLADVDLTVSDINECWGTPAVLEVDRDSAGLYEAVPLPYHSICHLFSAALLDGVPTRERPVLGFAVDGGPDFVADKGNYEHWYAGGIFLDGKPQLFSVESPGPLYNVAAQRYGLEEGTLMALATASPAHVELAELQRTILADTRFYGRAAFSDSAEVLTVIEARLRSLLSKTMLATLPYLKSEEHFVSAVMKQVQQLCVSIMDRNVAEAIAHFGLSSRQVSLALAGGYALNCPTNTHLMRQYGFRQLLAPPCVNDGGQSLGIALATFSARLGSFDFRFQGPYLGSRENDFDASLDNYSEFISDVRPMDCEQAVHDIQRSPVAWVNGRAEIGPRALGGRSILGDPSSMETKRTMNLIKQRQPWRPVAPVIIADQVTQWFDDARTSPYMLETFAGKQVTASLAPAILHIDGTARIQTVTGDQNPPLYKLLSQFAEATGIPMLCNTSLNDKGEPIIQTVGEAINFCLRKGLPVAYLADHRVEFRNAKRFTVANPARRPMSRFTASAEEVSALTKQYNPYALEPLYLQVWLRVPELNAAFDVTDDRLLPELRKAVDQWLAQHPWERDWYRDILPEHARYLAELDERGFAFGGAREWRSTDHWRLRLGTVVMSATGTAGDILPLIRIGGYLAERGHRGTLISHAPFAEKARGAGLEFVPLDTHEEYLELLNCSAGLVARPYDLEELDRAVSWYHTPQRLTREFTAVAERIATGPAVVLARYVSNAIAVSAAEHVGAARGWTLVSPHALAEGVAIETLHGDWYRTRLNKQRALFGLPPVGNWLGWLSTVAVRLGFWTDWFAPDVVSEPNAALVGFVGAVLADERPVPARLWEFLAAGEPPVLVTAGTGKMVGAGFFAAAVGGCLRLGRRVLLVGRYATSLPSWPRTAVLHVPEIPPPAVLPHVSAVIHHGGIGTSSQALATGTPQLVLAQGADRPDNAKRLRRLGVAETLSVPSWTPDAVVKALLALESPSVRNRAAEVALRMRNLNADDVAGEYVEHLLT